MTAEKTRIVDACAALVVWAPASASGQPECMHGVRIETRFEHETLERGWVVLHMRGIERETSTTLLATGEAVRVTCSLASGACTPNDHDAARFLHQRRWLAGAIRGELEDLRGRAARAAAQADRDTAPKRALTNADPSAMIPYDELFPADWDLIVTHAGASYWAVDLHCPDPRCPCTAVVVTLYRLDEGAERPPFVGDARLELNEGTIRVARSSPDVGEIVERVCAKYRDELRARHAEVRRAVLRFAAPKPIRNQPRESVVPQAGRIPRNAPCPCESGKKYKRCCIDAAVATSSRP